LKNLAFIFSSILFISCLNTYSQQKVLLQTSMGDVVVKLYQSTPEHSNNFIKLAKEGFYDSTFFHRIINNFMIQGGDPQSHPSSNTGTVGNGGPAYTLPAEINNQFIHKKGALAAARQGDQINPEKRSSGSQFYIVEGQKYPRKYMGNFEEKRGEKYTEEQLEAYETIGGTPHLDGEYTVFGEVISGMKVVEKISDVETASEDRPIKDVYIIKMKVLD